MADEIGRLAELGQDKGGKADGASPDYPADALRFEWRKLPASHEQNQEGDCINRVTREETDFGDSLGVETKHVGKGEEV